MLSEDKAVSFLKARSPAGHREVKACPRPKGAIPNGAALPLGAATIKPKTPAYLAGVIAMKFLVGLQKL